MPPSKRYKYISRGKLNRYLLRYKHCQHRTILPWQSQGRIRISYCLVLLSKDIWRHPLCRPSSKDSVSGSRVTLRSHTHGVPALRQNHFSWALRISEATARAWARSKRHASTCGRRLAGWHRELLRIFWTWWISTWPKYLPLSCQFTPRFRRNILKSDVDHKLCASSAASS